MNICSTRTSWPFCSFVCSFVGLFWSCVSACDLLSFYHIGARSQTWRRAVSRAKRGKQRAPSYMRWVIYIYILYIPARLYDRERQRERTRGGGGKLYIVCINLLGLVPDAAREAAVGQAAQHLAIRVLAAVARRVEPRHGAVELGIGAHRHQREHREHRRHPDACSGCVQG